MTNEARLMEFFKKISIYSHSIGKKLDPAEVVLQDVPSKDNVVDILTEGLGGN